MRVFFQIGGTLFALVLLRLAFNCIATNKDAKGWSFAFLAVIAFLASMFSGFFEPVILGKLFEANKQLDTFEGIVARMQTELYTQQKQLNERQKELNTVQGTIRTNQTAVLKSQMDITNQFSQVRALQSQLTIAQTNLDSQQKDIANQYSQLKVLEGQLVTAETNLDAQQKKLEDVEYWANNLFANMTTESIFGSDTNKVIPVPKIGRVFFMLSSMPIANSVQLVAMDKTGNIPIVMNQIKAPNVISFGYNGDWRGAGWVNKEYVFHYVKTPSQTNIIRSMVLDGNELIIDHSLHIPLP